MVEGDAATRREFLVDVSAVSWVSSAAGREREAATAEFGDLLLFAV